MIELQNIAYQYTAHQPVLETFNLKIQKGEVLVITGNNGSGKTTILRILAGIIPKFYGGNLTGTRKLYDQPYSSIDVSTFGVVLQGHEQQFIQNRVDQEIFFILESQNLPSKSVQTMFDQLIDDFHLKHLQERKIHTLSSGEQQLLRLALSFVFRPPILLLDEPLTFLDQSWQDKILNTLLHLKNKYNLTYVIADHRIESWGIFGKSVRHLELSKNDPVADGHVQIRPSKKSEIILEIQNVGLHFNHKEIFTGLTQKVFRGDCILVTGPNGCGKTSLLNMLMGHLIPTSGTITKISDLRIKYFVNPILDNFFSQRVEDEMLLSQSVDFFDLSDLYKEFVFDLSQGQQRQVALSLFDVEDLDLLLLDEPFLNLDKRAEIKFLEFIQRQKDKNVTVIFSAPQSQKWLMHVDQVWSLGL